MLLRDQILIKSIMKTQFQSLFAFCFIIIIFSCTGKTPKTSETSDTVEKKGILLPEKLDIEWKFDELGEAEYGAPKTMVSVIVNGKVILVEKEIQESCSEMDKSEYVDRRIPDSALTAFSSWWAGGGTINYIQKVDNKLFIYRAFIDEAMDDSPIEWKVIKEISVSDL